MESAVVLAIAVVVVVAAIAGGLFIWLRSDRTDIARDVPAPPVGPTPVPSHDGMRTRLAATRRALADRLSGVLSRSHFDSEYWADLEDGLVAADMGVAAASRIVGRVRERSPQDAEAARNALSEELRSVFAGRDRSVDAGSRPSVVLVVGVNGTGKTTSIAKLAAHFMRSGKRVLLGAADTFRAAADEQLRLWAGKVGADIVGGQAGADPASVAFDALQSATANGYDVLIVDTAGRLQTKANLMDELGKVARVLRRDTETIDEVLLVIDGTTGQNAVSQARIFTEAVGVTGVVLTKLDGSARGGVAVAVEEELDLPVKFLGVGEGVDDLLPFEPDAFVDALIGV